MLHSLTPASIRTARPRARRLATGMAPIAAAAGVALLLSACSSSSAADTPAATNGGQGGNQQQRTPPGASGLIAEITGTTLQVQGTSQQTAVTYTSSTTITKDVAVALADVKAGQCVTANGTPDVNGASALTATTVRISDPLNGACTGGFGDPNGGQNRGPGPSGGPGGYGGYGGQRPSDAPSGVPSGGPNGGQGFAFANGKVTSKTATAIIVTGQLMSRGPSASQSTTAVPVTITVAADTRFTQVVKATPAALVVGQCARAIGPTDTKGVVAAATITVSAPVNGTCQNGFVGGRGRPGDGGGQPTGGASGA